MHQRQEDGRGDADAEADEGRAEDRRGRGRGEGGDQHLALERDVEDAGAFRIEARERREEQRRRQPDGGVGDVDPGGELHQRASSTFAPAGSLVRVRTHW